MAKKLTIESASRLLADVPPDKVFYVFNGPLLKNLEELKKCLESINDETFAYHRSHIKNDFYNWVLFVVGDARLANDIARCKTGLTTLKKVKERVEALKKIKG